MNSILKTIQRSAHHLGFLFFVMLLLACPVSNAAEYNGFQFIGNPTGITITNYVGGSSIVNIPSAISGIPVRSIGDRAFCPNYFFSSSLNQVTIPSSVTNIGNEAFAYCSSLMSVTFSNGIKSIGAHAFYQCALQSVILPDSVFSIGEDAFGRCANLTNIVFPKAAVQVGYMAFQYCSNLKTVSISAGVTNFGYGPFFMCTNLTNISVEAANEFYSSKNGVLFDKSGTTLVQYPPGKTLGEDMFSGVTGIAGWALAGCSGLTNGGIPAVITSIGCCAFFKTLLMSVTIPNSLTNIDCGAFAYCTNLTNVEVAAGNSFYCSQNGVLFDNEKRTLIQFPGKLAGSYTVPDTVTSIENWAFAGALNLTEVNFPGSVADIGTNAFYGCLQLSSVIIPSSVVTIGAGAFQYAGLSSVKLSTGLKTIGDYAFYDCYLSNLVIPGSVTRIGNYALYEFDRSFNKVFFQGDAPSFGSNVFRTLYYDGQFYYLAGTKGWSTNSAFNGNPATCGWQANSIDLEPSVSLSGQNLVMRWAQGSLMETTNLAKGPWTTNGAVSPYTNTLNPAVPVKFYRVGYP